MPHLVLKNKIKLMPAVGDSESEEYCLSLRQLLAQICLSRGKSYEFYLLHSEAKITEFESRPDQFFLSSQDLKVENSLTVHLHEESY